MKKALTIFTLFLFLSIGAFGAELKTVIDALGARESTITIFKQYAITTDTTVPTNITLKFLQGGSVLISTTKTLTINGRVEAGLYEIFEWAGTGAVSFGPGSTREIYPQWWGAKGDGATDDTTDIQAAIDAASAGSTLRFPSTTSYYEINDDLDVAKALTIAGDGEASEIRQIVDAKMGFNITASNVTIKDLKLYGHSAPASYVEGAHAVYAHGADSGHYIKNIKVIDCFIENWGKHGILSYFTEQFEYNGNHIESITYAGIMGISVLDGHIHHNYIDDIKCHAVNDNGYGISLTRIGDSDLGPAPRSTRVLVDHNIVKNVLLWEGLDTHSGEQITFDSNQVYDCNNGLTVTGSTLADTVTQVIARNIHVINNLFDASGLTLGETDAGIYFANANTAGVTGMVIGNTIKGYGDEDSIAGTPTGGIRIYYTNGLIVKGNYFEDCSPAAIIFDVENIGFVCTGNTISNPWTDTADNGNGHARGIYVVRTNNTGYIGENIIIRGTDLSKTYELDTAAADDGRAIEVANAAGNIIYLGANYSEATTEVTDVGDKTGITFMGNSLGIGGSPGATLDVFGDAMFGHSDTGKISLKNAGGDEVSFLQSSGAGGGELDIDADSNINFRPANTEIARFLGAGGHLELDAIDFYMANNQAIKQKDVGGAYQIIISLSNTDDLEIGEGANVDDIRLLKSVKIGANTAPATPLDVHGDGRFGGIGEATKIALWNGVGDERAFLQLTGTGGGELIIDADSNIQIKPANTLAVTFLADGGVKMVALKSGINQGAAGAAAGELWIDTDDDNTLKVGT